MVIVLVTAVRFVVRTLAGRVIGRERALLVGTGGSAKARRQAGGPSGVPARGDRHSLADRLLRPSPVVGGLEQLEEIVAARVTRVLFSRRELEEGELERMLRDCRALSLKVSVLPRLADVLGPAIEIDDVEGVTVLGVNPPWLPRSSRAMKRGMDLLIAIPLLIIVAPLLAILAIAIKLDSRGPVFFVQERVGRGSRHFRLFKLRTMTVDAEQLRAELVARSSDPDWLKLERDPGSPTLAAGFGASAWTSSRSSGMSSAAR